MKKAYVIGDNIYSPLGKTTAENLARVSKGESGVQRHDDNGRSTQPFFAALFGESDLVSNDGGYTKFELLLIESAGDAIRQSRIDVSAPDCLLIVSTTKGSISLVETPGEMPAVEEAISLHQAAQKVADHFGFTTRPVVVSNACISGILAMLIGLRYIRQGKYQHVVVAGGDLISRFILSGFQSFQAVSDERCRPFDSGRKGINLGEAAATVVLSASPAHAKYMISGGSVSNDANHISGPSRTGEELSLAINRALADAGLQKDAVDFISAHGTATLYNDEMEAKAIGLSGLDQVPVNSLKGFYGHTLGAAGLVESILSAHAMQDNTILPTPGFRDMGVSVPLKVNNNIQTGTMNVILKTASGFGGCNAALVLEKHFKKNNANGII